MHAVQALAALAAWSRAAHAFAGTYPVVALSDSRLPLASLLDRSTLKPAAASASNQQAFQADDGTSPEDDLCALSSLVFIAAPGLAYSDLALLPPSAESSIRASLASDATGSSLTLPYVPERQADAHAPASRLARRFAQCDGGKDRIVVKEVTGLESTVAGTANDREARKAVLRKIDDLVHSHLSGSPGPHAVVLSAVRPSLLKKAASGKPCPHARAALTKRQAADETLTPTAEDTYVEELLEEIAAEEASGEASLADMLETMDAVEEAAVLDRPVVDDGAAPTKLTEEEYAKAVEPYLSEADGAWDGSVLDVTASLQQDDGGAGSGNGTSIFQPKEKSGLFHRYVFFTPALVLSILITLILLIPVVLVGASALLAIETPQGLETKMTGTVGLDPGKAQ